MSIPFPISLEYLLTCIVFVYFIVVKLPKRWWRQAPKSRGTLLRCTGEWGAPFWLWGGCFHDRQRHLKARLTHMRLRIHSATAQKNNFYPNFSDSSLISLYYSNMQHEVKTFTSLKILLRFVRVVT